MMSVVLTKELASQRLGRLRERKYDQAEFRLSETGWCRRGRVLRVLGYEADPVPDDVLGLFETGHVWEEWIHSLFREKYPRKTRTQVEVPTPYGTGHIDIYFPNPPDGNPRIIEVKAVRMGAKFYGLPKDEHIAQVQSYLYFGRKYGIKLDGRIVKLPENTTAEIVYVIRETLDIEPYPVYYNELAGQRAEKELIELTGWAERGEAPPIPAAYGPDTYPCYYQTRDYEVFCPFYKHCHDGTEASEAVTDETLAAKFKEYYAARMELTTANKKAEAVKAKVKALEDELEDVFNAKNAEVIKAGGYQLKRSKVDGRRYYRVEKAIDAGVIPPDLAEVLKEHYSSQSDGYTRWYISKPKEKGGKIA